MEDITNSLNKLITICGNLGLPFVQLLNKGQNLATIMELTSSLDLTLPTELINLYEFCDGIDQEGRTPEEVGIYYGYSIIPLREAIDEYRELQLEIITEGWDDILQSWFPLLRIDSNFYFVDCDTTKAKMPYIISYMFDSGPEIMYQSIQSMIDTFADCYGEGAFVVESGNFTVADSRLEAQIAARHNPNVAYWRDRP